MGGALRKCAILCWEWDKSRQEKMMVGVYLAYYPEHVTTLWILINIDTIGHELFDFRLSRSE